MDEIGIDLFNVFALHELYNVFPKVDSAVKFVYCFSFFTFCFSYKLIMNTTLSRLLFGLCAASWLFWGMTGCSKPQAPKQERPPVPVQVQTAKAMSVPLYIDTIGQTTAYNAVSIQPQVSGQLMQIHFKQGSTVKKGDLLFTIDEAPFKAALMAARAQLAKDQADLEINQKQLERSEVLLPKKYVSEQTYQQYEANVKMLKAAIEADKAQIRQAQINLNYCRITSPVDGLVGNYLINEGNIVQAQSSVLTTIRQMDPIYADFVVPSQKFAQVRAYLDNSKDRSLNVEISPLSDPSRKRVAKLKIVGNQVNPSTGTVNLRAEMDNNDRMFWPNEQISARVILTMLPNTVLVPQSSVRYNAQGSFVWTIKDGVAHLSLVELGQLQDGGYFGLIKGVKDGETVVTAGSLMLQPGSKVVVIDPSKPNTAPKTAAPAK